MRPALGCALGALALGSCGSAAVPQPSQPVQHRPSPIARAGSTPVSHIAVILMENKEYGGVIGAHSAPYINGLARRYALATRMYAISHPSLPNYLALTGGSTFGISSDCTSCAVHATSIVDQLDQAHVSWKAYMEGLPHPCFTGPSAGDYAKKHDPFVYYTPVSRNPARCGRVVPLSQLGADEHAGAIPRSVWITPNLCHDMHDCSVATGDRFLAGLVPPLLSALGPRGLLFITWDEGSTDSGCCRLAAGGHIGTIVAGGAARQGVRLATPADHYSVLQTIEDLLGLPRLRGAACACTPSLAPLLATGAAPPGG
jgi:phosphatidylinositol-3-phosphatase